VYNDERQNSKQVSAQLVAGTFRNLRTDKLFLDHVTGLIVIAPHNALATLPGVMAMVEETEKPIAINYEICVNDFDTYAVKTAHFDIWCDVGIGRIDPAQKNSNPRAA
jgi:hypothetical protein